MPDSVTTQLEHHFERLARLPARRRLLARWAGDTDLAGRTAADIIDLCEQRSVDQNPVIAALLRHHQNGDRDAGVIVLTALRPMIKRVIGLRHTSALNRDLLDNYWSAASHLIGSIDPTVQPLGRRSEPTPFLTYLGDRLYSHLRQLDPAGRRTLDRRRHGQTLVPVDTSTHDHEYVSVDNRTSATAVEDAAIARVELAQVLDAVHHGAVTFDRWQRLVEHRLGIAPHPRTASDRVNIHRTANRLAELVGHAA